MTTKEIENKVDELMKRKYKFELIEDTDEGGFAVSYPDLQGCVSFGETVEEAIANGEDARREWTWAMVEDGKTVPEPFDAEEYSGQFRLRMPKSLHKHLAERSKKEGISMNQYCIYILSQA
ncbi:MAG: type II toxin-antitoxin system HicB family antitoxin [Eubacterium sp.]|nr:type II toxin-antitoxin system HicB family antitoxin [Eubacterium sp.]MBR4242180.1 type II toxin-antitoxin system HicB family antitoxin [Eubacterium sp.]